MFLKHWDDRRVARHNYVWNFLFAHNAVERIHHFFRMIAVRILHAPLISRLRPSPHLHALNFLSLDLFIRKLLAQSKHENPCGIGIAYQRRIARILVIQPRQVIEMRPVADI